MTAVVRDVMTRRVVTVTPATRFREIVARMRRGGFAGLPVIGPEGRPVGFVSEADLLAKAGSRAVPALAGARGSLWRRELHARAAGVFAYQLMSSPAVIVRPDAPLAEAARLMHWHGLLSLPVVDGDGELVGIVSRGDLLTVFLRDDVDIRRDVRAALAAAAGELAPRVAVRDGVVTMDGEVPDESRARALVAAAGRVDGVVAVRSRLVGRDAEEDMDEQPRD